jgi:uncharacterized protein
LLDRSEKFHQSCAAILHDLRTLLVTCEAVIAESCYLLRRLPRAAETVLENVEAAIFQIPYRLSRDTVATKQCFRKDRDRRIDLADACLIRLADQLETPDILTLDKDFRIYRWRRNRPFNILVDLT